MNYHQKIISDNSTNIDIILKKMLNIFDDNQLEIIKIKKALELRMKKHKDKKGKKGGKKGKNG